MNSRIYQLAQRIRSELSELERVVKRSMEGWQRAQRTGDDYYLDSVALNLHGMYAGLERIFELIAGILDQSRPEGENWHQELLKQMAQDLAPVRPAVISESTRDRLEAYRGFRHVVRNIYTFRFDSAKIEKLIDELPHLLKQLQAELLAFADFLEKRI